MTKNNGILSIKKLMNAIQNIVGVYYFASVMFSQKEGYCLTLYMFNLKFTSDYLLPGNDKTLSFDKNEYPANWSISQQLS